MAEGKDTRVGPLRMRATLPTIWWTDIGDPVNALRGE
jgi:hypothetical protein